MRTVVIICLVAVLLFLAWKFDLWWFAQEFLDTLKSLSAVAREYTP